MQIFPAQLQRINPDTDDKPVNPPNSPVSPHRVTVATTRKQHKEPMDKVISGLKVTSHAAPFHFLASLHSANASETDDIKPAAGGPVSFTWTAVAIGWYNALIWSRIYLQEAEAFQGSGGLYSSTDIKLFRRQGASQEISLRSPKGAIDAVGLSLANRFSSINLPDALGGGGGSGGGGATK